MPWWGREGRIMASWIPPPLTVCPGVMGPSPSGHVTCVGSLYIATHMQMRCPKSELIKNNSFLLLQHLLIEYIPRDWIPCPHGLRVQVAWRPWDIGVGMTAPPAPQTMRRSADYGHCGRSISRMKMIKIRKMRTHRLKIHKLKIYRLKIHKLKIHRVKIHKFKVHKLQIQKFKAYSYKVFLSFLLTLSLLLDEKLQSSVKKPKSTPSKRKKGF